MNVAQETNKTSLKSIGVVCLCGSVHGAELAQNRGSVTTCYIIAVDWRYKGRIKAIPQQKRARIPAIEALLNSCTLPS